jgi:hypothetical protein
MGRTRRPAVLTGKLCGCGQSYVGVLGVQQLRRKLYLRFVSSFSFLLAGLLVVVELLSSQNASIPHQKK